MKFKILAIAVLLAVVTVVDAQDGTSTQATITETSDLVRQVVGTGPADVAFAGSEFAIESTSAPMMEIKQDGTVLINDKPVESLSHPEIKEALKEIAAATREQSALNDKFYSRQTDMLLRELELCRKKCSD